MKTIAKFFIENNKLTFVLSVFVVFFGLRGLIGLNSESFPPVDFAMAIISTNYDGATAEDIETKITKPIEDEIRKISGIKDVRSVSQAGASRIFVRADIDNVDVPQTMADVQRAVDRASLPPDLPDRPIFQEIKSEEFPVVELAIVGSNEDRTRDRVADLLKEDIEDNKNILSVRQDGFQKREFQVILDSKKLQRFHIGVNEVLAKVQSRNVNIPGGHLKQAQKQQLLRIEGKIKDKSQLENIVLRSNFSGQQIYLKDVATVEDGEEEARVIAHHNGEDATLLIVNKKAGADTLELVADIKQKISYYQKKYDGEYKFVIYNDEGVRVRNRLDVLNSNAVSGLILVILFLFIFLPGKIGFMASLSLPIAVLATVGFMPVFDMNLNAITILALVIALGMMVDNSVVISENYSRLRKDGEGSLQAATHSIAQLWLPITATAFTTIAAFLPMLVTKGIMGEFIKFIPIIVTTALLASLMESFIFLPMRLVLGGKGKKLSEQRSDWFQTKVVSRFSGLVDFLLRRRYLALGAFSALLVGSVLMLTVGNKFILFPADQTEIYVGRLEMDNGTRLEQTSVVLKEASRKAKEALGEHLPHIVSRAGTSQTNPTDPKSKDGNNVGMLVMYVDEYARDNIPHTEILAKLRKIELDVPGVMTWEAMVNGPPVGDPVNATFRSNDSKNLKAVISGVMADMEKVPGVINVKVDDVIGDDEIFVDIDYAKADRLGLNVDSVGNTIRSAISGKAISSVNLSNKDVDIKIRLDAEFRERLEDLKQLKVMDPRGNLIPLGSIAEFRTQKGAPQIKRFDYKRSKTVTAGIEEGQITAMQANGTLKKVFEKLQEKYKDVSLVFGGEEESTKESLESLWSALVLSLIGIFALLVFLFRSYFRPLIIMTTIPLGLVGFSVAFALHGRPVSFLALIGIIGLGGIIVNSGIVLISFIDQMREEGGRSLHEILVRASSLRLRAVVVSSLTTIMGLLPTAYGIGGSDAILIPMTLAMAWGLTSGTILTLIWVPCAYLIVEDVGAWVGRLIGRTPKAVKVETKPIDRGSEKVIG